jgi:hypothetical protein
MKHYNEIEIVRSLSRVAEYMYRKGLMDSAETSDPQAVNALVDMEDAKRTFQFLYDEGGRPLRRDLYCDLLCVIARKVKTEAVRAVLTDKTYSRTVRNGIPVLMNAMYRLGLKDGLKVEFNEAEDLFEDIGTGTVHSRPNGKRLSNDKFIDDMRLELSRIDSEALRDVDANEARALRDYIARTLEEDKAKKRMADEDFYYSGL